MVNYNEDFDGEEGNEAEKMKSSQAEPVAKYKEREAVGLMNFLDGILTKVKKAENLPLLAFYDDGSRFFKARDGALIDAKEGHKFVPMMVYKFPNGAYALTLGQNCGYMHPDGSQDDSFLELLKFMEEHYEIA